MHLGLRLVCGHLRSGRHRSLPIGLSKPVPFALKRVGRQRNFRSGIRALYPFPTDVSTVDIKRAEALQRLFMIAFPFPQAAVPLHRRIRQALLPEGAQYRLRADFKEMPVPGAEER